MALQTGIFADLLGDERKRIESEAMIASAFAKRSSLENPQTPLSYPAEWLLDIFNGGRTDSGVRVSELTAFQVSTFLSGVDLISSTIAMLPRHVKERSVSAKNARAMHRVAYEHDYYDLINLEPNSEMSAPVMWKAFMCHVLAWSNAYIEIQRDEGAAATALWPRNPAKTHPRRVVVDTYLKPEPWRPYPVTLKAGTLAYQTSDMLEQLDNSETYAKSAVSRWIPAEDIIFVPGITFDGRIGQSVVWLARQTLGLALATEKFGAKYFANFAKPGGILEVPQQKKEDRDKTRESWLEAQGGENSHRVAVMPTGTKWTPISNNPTDAQTIETRQHVRTEIAAILHLPLRMVGDTSRSSRASTEQESIEYLNYTLSGWLELIKAETKRKLFPIKQKATKNFYVDFDTWELVRGDAASREKYYASGRQWGYLCANDVKTKEKDNPIEEDWAELYWMPVNMTLTTTPINPGLQDGAGHGEVPPKEPNVKED